MWIVVCLTIIQHGGENENSAKRYFLFVNQNLFIGDYSLRRAVLLPTTYMATI